MVSQSKLEITRKLFYWLTISNFLYIIVLLILAGVTIATLTGENGLLNKAQTAKNETEKKTATEAINFKITNVQMSKYAEEQRMPTLKELADNFCEDNDFEKVVEKTEIGSLTKISNENPTAIIAKLKAYPYEFEINSSLQLASIDGVKVATVPVNDDDTIVSMTKSELKKMIQDEIESFTSSTNTSVSNIYSTTEEQIVGTWINGKKIYRKVLSANDLNITPTQSTSRYATSINLTQSNMDKLISCTGYIEVLENSTNNMVFTVGSSKMHTDNSMQRNNYIFNNSLIYESLYGNDRVKCYNVIIEYTKTSDTPTE